jgi:hypothetical protein
MTVSSESAPPWLLLVFGLPVRSASQRVQVWRKLQRYGALALRSSGHVLPNTPANRERMEWLATAIRSHRGQASVVLAESFDDLPANRLKALFRASRTRDYQQLVHETRRVMALPASRRPNGKLNRIRRRFAEVQEIDFFGSPLREKLESLLAKADHSSNHGRGGRSRRKSTEFTNRTWMTRPRPGIDCVSSAWLIRRYIDSKARFVFAADPAVYPDAIPFDMYCEQGFGHRGEDCTFETLCKEFGIRERKVRRIAEIIHDADLGDQKYGRPEGQVLDKVLNGWERHDLPDEELLQKGMDVIEGLYQSAP